MMKKVLIFSTFILMGATAFATVLTSDTTGIFMYKDRKYQISDTTNVISISVFDKTTEKFEPVCQSGQEIPDNEVERQLQEVFSYPFSNLINKKKNKTRFNPHWAGVGIGFCNVMDNGMNFIDNQHGLSINFSRSFEVFWNIFNIHYSFRNTHWGLVSGIGLDWRNYVMDKNYKFIRQDNRIQVEKVTDPISLDYSRLKTLDITIPLLAEWQTTGKARLFISFGPVIGIKTYSSLKNIYSEDGIEKKYFERSLNPNPINVDLLLQAGFCNIALYAKYSPFNIFQSQYAPAMKSFSTGIMLVF